MEKKAAKKISKGDGGIVEKSKRRRILLQETTDESKTLLTELTN